MEPRQQIALNAVLGFCIAAGLPLFLGEPVVVALAFGVVAGVGFGLGVWLLGRYEAGQAK